MRVIAGKLGGHNFNSPRNQRTHPMSDKIRGALFNILGDISDLTILDAFAGSGALSFEAISRGAKSVVAIDADADAYSTIVANAKLLNISSDQLKITRANCFTWSTNNPDSLFDIVIVDPPFEEKRLNRRHVFKMLDNLKISGVFVASLPSRDQLAAYHTAQLPRLEEIIRRDYGDAELVFFRRIA